MKNYYQVLGIDATANADEIKRAYRKLAGQHHPDKGGDTQKFQEIQKAYEVLGDQKRRAEYDNPGMHMFGNNQAFNFDSIFDIFGTRFQQQQPRARAQARMSLWITLSDVARGGIRTISIGTHQGVQAIEIEIPTGIDDGDTVQYPGLAPGGTDLIVTYRIHPDAKWQRQGINLTTEHHIPVWDCILGGETQLRDILGNQLSLTIPPRTQPGSMLRLRGRGLTTRQGASGDLFVKIQARIPELIDSELLSQIQKYR
jgi:DnaJ-class molecular chaperone